MAERHPYDECTFEDGRSFQLVNEHILVRVDPTSDKTTSGLIFKASEKAIESIYTTATILAFGYIRSIPKKYGRQKFLEEPVPIPDLEVGLKCCFLRFRDKQATNEHIQHQFGAGIILLKPADLLFVYNDGEGPETIV